MSDKNILNPDLELEQEIKSRLQALTPSFVELTDDSHKHIGHTGVKERGGRHYSLKIVSSDFTNLSLIKRHQKIYHLLDDLMKHKIHALRIDAKDN